MFASGQGRNRRAYDRNEADIERVLGDNRAVPQPTLRTTRLTLVPLADQHLDDEAELDSDPEVMRFLTGRAMTREEVETRHAGRLAEGRLVDGLGFWAGFVDGEFVGWWILGPVVADGVVVAGAAELGYRLRRAWWRRGLASEGSRELLRYGFEEVGLERVHAETMAVNAGSRAVMASVGLRYVRTFDGGYDDDPLPGSEHGEVEYAVTRAEWSAQPLP